MKNFILTLSLSLCVVFTFAQNSKVNSTWNYMNSYDRDGKTEFLLKAKESIEEAVKHETTSISGKAWFYRGKVYYKMSTDSTLSSMQPDALDLAFQSFSKAADLNDKKFKAMDELIQFVQSISTVYFNKGVENFNVKDFESAYKNFSAIPAVNELLEAKGKDVLVSSKDAVNNAAMAASNAGLTAESIELYEKIIAEGSPDAGIYRLLANAYKVSGDEAKSKETIAAGIAKFPDNVDLIIDELNFYLAEDKHEEAIGKLKQAVDLDPTNDQLHYVLGTAYDKLGDYENARASYESAVKVNPENFRAYYNLGAIYFNQAGTINDEMNELDWKEQKKYDELKAKRNELFIQAKPFFDQAAAINPEDPDVVQALKKINGLIEE